MGMLTTLNRIVIVVCTCVVGCILSCQLKLLLVHACYSIVLLLYRSMEERFPIRSSCVCTVSSVSLCVATGLLTKSDRHDRGGLDPSFAVHACTLASRALALGNPSVVGPSAVVPSALSLHLLLLTGLFAELPSQGGCCLLAGGVSYLSAAHGAGLSSLTHEQ